MTKHQTSTQHQNQAAADPEGSKEGANCSAGACGGPGLCPGLALLLGYLAGSGIAHLTGLTWLGWALGIPVAAILITGAWRFIPNRRKS